MHEPRCAKCTRDGVQTMARRVLLLSAEVMKARFHHGNAFPCELSQNAMILHRPCRGVTGHILCEFCIEWMWASAPNTK